MFEINPNQVERMTGRSLEDWDQIYANRRAIARQEMEVTEGTPMLMSHMIQNMSTYGLDRSDFQLVWFCRDENTVEPGWVTEHNNELEEELRSKRITETLYRQLRIRPETTNETWIWKSVDTTHMPSHCRSIMGYRFRQDRFEKLFPRPTKKS